MGLSSEIEYESIARGKRFEALPTQLIKNSRSIIKKKKKKTW